MTVAGARRCSSCGAEGERDLPTVDHLTGDSFLVLVCPACGRGTTDPVPPDLARYYPVEYYGSRGIRFHPAVEAVIAASRAARARAVIRARPGGRSILDVGCGRGLMLAALARRGWRSAGVEATEAAAAPAREVLGLDVRVGDLAGAGFPEGSFDAVTLFHVLEHLADPDAALAEVQRLLAPGGVAVIEVPNLGSLQARLSGGGWFHLDAPRHLVHFDRPSLLAALGRAGLLPVRVATHSFEFGYYGMLQSLLNGVTRQPNVLYGMLKNRFARPAGAATADVLLTLALLLPLGLVSLPLEALAAAAGRGAVLRVVARKR